MHSKTHTSPCSEPDKQRDAQTCRETRRCTRRCTGKERLKHRRRQAETGRWRGRHRQTHRPAKAAADGLSPAVPDTAQGNLCGAPGLRRPEGLLPAPLLHWGQVAYSSMGSLQDEQAVGGAGEGQRWGHAWRRGAQDTDSSPVQLCCREHVVGGLRLQVFSQELKEQHQFISCPHKWAGPSQRQGFVGSTQGHRADRKGHSHPHHLQAKIPALEQSTPGPDLSRDQWEVSDLWEQQHKCSCEMEKQLKITVT